MNKPQGRILTTHRITQSVDAFCSWAFHFRFGVSLAWIVYHGVVVVAAGRNSGAAMDYSSDSHTTDKEREVIFQSVVHAGWPNKPLFIAE